MKRRHVLSLLGSTIPLAGCSSPETGTPNGTSTDELIPETDESSSQTPTATPKLTSGLLLPSPTDAWELKRTEEEDWRYMNGSDGEHGFYTSPEGIPFEVIVVDVMENSEPESIAKAWKCDTGWQVTLAYQGFAIAAGSGTSQERGTPDAPKMTRTPSPDTSDDARQLLSYSPRLNSDVITNREIRSC